MSPLAQVFPWLQPLLAKLPFTRDQLVLLMMALSLALTGVETYISHSAGAAFVSRAWIPVVFGPLAGAMLAIACLVAVRWHTAASLLATCTLLASIGVGLLGTVYHLEFGLRPDAPPGYRVSLHLLGVAPPVLGPMMFVLFGVLGISAAWREDPPDSGILRITRRWRLRLPYSKTRAYFFIVGTAGLISVISVALDHSNLHFARPELLAPVVVGVFATTVAMILGILDRPGLGDYRAYVFAMVLMIVVGAVGAVFHFESDLVGNNQLVAERLLRGRPIMAPLLLSAVGTMGLFVLLDPRESSGHERVESLPVGSLGKSEAS